MGQQQLLLVILVTIIVGIATVVAINTFGSAADSANMDAVRQDLTSLAADAQGYYMKPEMMDGGGNKFTNITMEDLNCPGELNGAGDECTNENGTYTISDISEDEFTLNGVPNSDTDVTISGTVEPDDAGPFTDS